MNRLLIGGELNGTFVDLPDVATTYTTKWGCYHVDWVIFRDKPYEEIFVHDSIFRRDYLTQYLEYIGKHQPYKPQSLDRGKPLISFQEL